MRMLHYILLVVLGVYVAACVVALASGIAGVYGATSEPLAMVFAIALALPWSVVLGSLADGRATLALVLVVLCMACNAGVLWYAARLAACGWRNG